LDGAPDHFMHTPPDPLLLDRIRHAAEAEANANFLPTTNPEFTKLCLAIHHACTAGGPPVPLPAALLPPSLA
jgi:hypothetical protein